MDFSLHTSLILRTIRLATLCSSKSGYVLFIDYNKTDPLYAFILNIIYSTLVYHINDNLYLLCLSFVSVNVNRT